MAFIETIDLRASASGSNIEASRFGGLALRTAASKPDRSSAMIVKDPMSLRASLYIAAAGVAAPRMRSLAEGSQEMPAPASQGLVAWIDNYFRHTSADRMAVTSLAFWG
jgi:hypothetical protein